MKTLVLVLALALLVGAACCAANVSSCQYDVYAGWNLISCPLVPFNPDPTVVFAEAPQGVYNNLTRWDPTYGGITLSEDEPETFGNILLGDGYWLLCYSGPTTLHFSGVVDGVATGPNPSDRTDMWISLPGNTVQNTGAWHMIGNPFAHYVPVNEPDDWTGKNILFTDGTVMLTWEQASKPPYTWVNAQMDGWNAASGGLTVRYDGDGDFDYLAPGQGFWLMTYKPNIAMIIKAEPEITP